MVNIELPCKVEIKILILIVTHVTDLRFSFTTDTKSSHAPRDFTFRSHVRTPLQYFVNWKRGGFAGTDHLKKPSNFDIKCKLTAWYGSWRHSVQILHPEKKKPYRTCSSDLHDDDVLKLVCPGSERERDWIKPLSLLYVRRQRRNVTTRGGESILSPSPLPRFRHQPKWLIKAVSISPNIHCNYMSCAYLY